MEGFTKVGRFRPKNMKMFKSVFHECDINPPVTAKYLKLVIGKNAAGGDPLEMFEIKVYGTQ